jgi:archaellum biogenesis ATPase FlaH
VARGDTLRGEVRSTSIPSKPPGREHVVRIDPATEQVVLAAMLADADVRRRIVRSIPPDRWQVPAHKAAVAALAELERRQVAYDPAAVRRLFPDVDTAYLAELYGSRPEVPADLEHYVEGVRWDGLRADAVRGPIASLLEALVDPLTEPARAKSLARAVGEMFGAWKDVARVLPPRDVHAALSRELRERAAGRAVFPYGIPGLDVYQDEPREPYRLIPAARPGKVTIITGTSGSGKSTLACRIALGQARQRRRTIFGAWEMTANESLELLAVMSLAEEGIEVSRTRLQTGAPEEMIAAVEERAEQIGRWVRFVPNPFQKGGKAETNDRNLDIIRSLIEDTGADVFIADLWDRCLVDDDPSEIQQALWRQQKICDETRCHGILLQQQRLKDVEQRADKRPTREGIKGTSAWVDVGDTILGAYRPAQWKAVPDDLIVVDVLKQRHAPWPLSVELEWDPDRAWFGRGTSVPYDQPSGREDPGGIDGFLGDGGKKGGRGR